MEQKRGLIVHLADKDLWFHESVVNSWIIVILLTILSLVIYNKIKKADPLEKPKGLLSLAEILVGAIDGLVEQTMGKRNLKFAPYMMSLALFLALANLWGLLGMVPPTSDYNVTVALALITFFMIHFYGIKTKGIVNYIKDYGSPMILLTPINVIGEIANPISLSFRLFGNVLSGALIMSLVYGGLRHISSFLIPVVAAPLHAYFDVFSGILQTFIFIMLSMTYISSGMAEEEEEN